MNLNRKRFVVALGVKPGIEVNAYNAYRAGKAPSLTPKSLQGITGVRHTKEGIFLDSTRMKGDIFEGLSTIGFIVKHPKQVWRVSAERIAVIKKLNSLGFKIAVPKYLFTDQKLVDRVPKYNKVFKARSGKIGTINGVEVIAPSALWTRDLWIKHNNKRFKVGSNMFDAFGEGGQVVLVGERHMIASENLRSSHTVRKLASEGIVFHFVKDGWQEIHNLSKIVGKPIFRNIDHPDLFVGRAGGVLLVDPLFFKENSGILSSVSRQLGTKILTVPIEEASIYPANFLVLGENTIMIDKDAKRTIELLKQNGVNVIPTPVSLRANRASGGGVRCFVNEL